MNIGGSFDALLFISEQGRWVNFVNGWCKVQLVQNNTRNNMLYCRQDGQVFKLNQISVEYHCEVDVLFLDGLSL